MVSFNVPPLFAADAEEGDSEAGNKVELSENEQLLAQQMRAMTANREKGKPYFGFLPYTPRKREYSFELGSMWEERILYWVGFNFGVHLGRCMLTQSQTCQQYLDFIGGVGGREGQTNGLALGGLRWQFVNFPKYVSPSVSLLAGTTRFKDEKRNKNAFTYGLSYAMAVSVHENLDVKFDFRFGSGEHAWSQAMIVLGLRLDNMVQYFAGRVRDIGVGTVNVTGRALKSAARSVGLGGKESDDEKKNNKKEKQKKK